MRHIIGRFNAPGNSSSWRELSKVKRLPGLTFCFIALTLIVGAAPLNFDITFGSGGKIVSSPDGSGATFGLDYALQPDGKIIAAGGGSYFGFLVVRYNSDGSLDTTFGTNGLASIPIPDQSVSANAVDIQTDGKIVVGGTVSKFVNNQWVYDLAVARFNSDGSPDTTFDGDGKTTFSFNPEVITGTGVMELLSSLKIAGDGKIVVGGSAGMRGPGFSFRFIFARLNADGSLDSTFDGDGKLVGANGAMDLNDMTVLPDGSIVAVGSEVNRQFRIAYKYSASGSLIWSYLRNDIYANTNGLYGIAPQPDGKLIVVGRRGGTMGIIRLNADGTEDSSFNAPSNSYTTAVSVAIQPDGKIVANFYPNESYDARNSFNIVRYNSNGSLDSSFGTNGIFTATASGGVDYGNKILVQADGKILAGGYSTLENPTRYFFSMLRVAANPGATRRAFYDYDGDGRSDISVFRQSNGSWYLQRSTNGFSGLAFGQSGDKLAPADYDGDGKTDVAVVRNGNWYIQRSSLGFTGMTFGVADDVPVPADYDGDGRADIAVFRPSNGTWYLLQSTAGYTVTAFGLGTDKPVPGDYNGDGRAEVAVFRPSNGYWYLSPNPATNYGGVLFGQAEDRPVPADYDGDGKTDVAVFRPSNGTWYLLQSSAGFTGIAFGLGTDAPVPADYDGDGKADVAVFRQGNWYLNRTTQGFTGIQFGASTDTPTPGAFVR